MVETLGDVGMEKVYLHVWDGHESLRDLNKSTCFRVLFLAFLFEAIETSHQELLHRVVYFLFS